MAASAALVRQYLKDTDIPEEDYAHVTNCLLMSGYPILDEENGTLYFVRRQGAGMVNIGAAMDAEAYIQVGGHQQGQAGAGRRSGGTGVYEMTFEVVNFSRFRQNLYPGHHRPGPEGCGRSDEVRPGHPFDL